MSKKTHESGVKQAQNELKQIQKEENRIATGMMGGREGGREVYWRNSRQLDRMVEQSMK